jgi:hypothetical protein
MDNEKGVLRTLLVSLEFQLALHNRLTELEVHYKAFAENVLDELPQEVRKHYEERAKDLLNQAKSDTSLVPYGIREAIAEIPDLLRKIG